MENPLPTYGQYEILVRRYLLIEDITIGSGKDPFIVRYRGHLTGESHIQYDQLAEALRPYNITPLFRPDGDRHAILLIPGLPQPKPSNPRTNLIFFLLALICVWWTGGLYALGEEITTLSFGQQLLAIIRLGWPYTLALLSILGAHEFAHYFIARRNGVNVTLPYFIPLPPFISPFGTLGAVINMRSIPKNRRVLFDVGVAGPIAGLVIAIPVLLYGLSTSTLSTLPQTITQPGTQGMEGNSILYLLLKYLVFGQLLPAPVSYETTPLLYWLRYFFTGRPFPFGGLDVSLNAVAWAGWTGLLVTAINLIPAGTLDGGHIIASLLGERVRKLFPYIMGAMILLVLASSSWLLMAALIFFLGRVYAEPLDTITKLDPPRRLLGVIMIIVFFLIFMPAPLSIF